MNPRLLRSVAVGAAGLLLVLLAVLTAGVSAVDRGLLTGPIQKLASQKLGRTVRFRRLSTHLLSSSPTFTIEDLVVGSPPEISRDDLLTAPRLTGQVRLAPLLVGRLVLTRLEVERPELHLVRLGHGRNNYSVGSGGGSGPLRSVASLVIASGRVRFDDPERRATLVGAFSHDGRPGVRLPLSLSGGGEMQGEPYRAQASAGPFNGRSPDAPYPFDATIQDGAVRLQVAGTTQKPFDFRGFDFDVRASGPNLADIRHLFGALAPNSPRFSLTGHVRRTGHAVRLSSLETVVGSSDLAGDIFTDHPPGARRLIRATLRSRTLRLADVRAMLGPVPPHALTRSTPGAAPPGAKPSKGRIFPDTPFETAALRKTDLTLDLRAASVPDAGSPVTGLAARLKLAAGDLALAPVSFTTGSGRAEGAARLDVSGATPQASISGALTGARLAQLAPGLERVADAPLDLRVNLRGRGPSPHAIAASASGTVSVRAGPGRLERRKAAALGGDLLGAIGLSLGDPPRSARLACGVGDLSAEGGRLRVNRLEVVTDFGVTRGEGLIDLGAERIGLTLHGQPAGRRLVRTDVPVRIEGPLAHPKTSVAKGAALKAVGLGLLTAPLQAVLPFAGTPAPDARCGAPARARP